MSRVARMEDLEDPDTKVKVIIQVLEMKMPPTSELQPQTDVWDWTGEFPQLDVKGHSDRFTKAGFLLEIPSAFIYPLGPIHAFDRRTPEQKAETPTLLYPTWRLTQKILRMCAIQLGRLWTLLANNCLEILSIS